MYNIRCGYCGTDYYISHFWLVLWFLIRGEYYHHCPNCHRVSRYRCIHHFVHDVVDSKEKEYNKNIRKEVER